MLQLNQYPSAIANIQVQIHKLDIQLEQLYKIIKQIESTIDSIIAFDKTLYNDTQRKSKRQQLLQEHISYWEFQENISDLRAIREIKNIDLGRLRDEFSVLKLEKRETIARMELQVVT